MDNLTLETLLDFSELSVNFGEVQKGSIHIHCQSKLGKSNRLTNGIVEGINNAIKTLKRVAHTSLLIYEFQKFGLLVGKFVNNCFVKFCI
jgi:hypothetical protein